MNSLENMIKQVILQHYVEDGGTNDLVNDLAAMINDKVVKGLQDKINEQHELINSTYDAANG